MNSIVSLHREKPSNNALPLRRPPLKRLNKNVLPLKRPNKNDLPPRRPPLKRPNKNDLPPKRLKKNDLLLRELHNNSKKNRKQNRRGKGSSRRH